MIEKSTEAVLADSKETIKVNPRLPKIILPASKLKMFADWWDSDIRYETEIPHAFEEGYLIIDNEDLQTYSVDTYSEFIKAVAKEMHCTYREIENEFKIFLASMEEFTLYFKFISNNSMYVGCYDRSGKKITDVTLSIGEKSEYDLPMSAFKQENIHSVDTLLKMFMHRNVFYLATCLWYIASTSNNTKYVYEEARPVVIGRHKGVVKVSDTKYIKTPVYDMNKIKVVKVERLISRKKGWTYSHSFQVHGHYRHYKSGHVIFVDSYIKGKGKPFMPQQVVLAPNSIKEE